MFREELNVGTVPTFKMHNVGTPKVVFTLKLEKGGAKRRDSPYV